MRTTLFCVLIATSGCTSCAQSLTLGEAYREQAALVCDFTQRCDPAGFASSYSSNVDVCVNRIASTDLGVQDPAAQASFLDGCMERLSDVPCDLYHSQFPHGPHCVTTTTP